MALVILSFPLLLGSLPGPATGTFRSLLPEFNTAPDVLAQSRLDMAELQIDPAIWGRFAGEGHLYMAAHLLAISPGGMFSRLLPEHGADDIYLSRYNELVVMRASVALPGLRIVC